MNVDGHDFLNFKIPDGVKKDVDIKTMAEEVSYFVFYLFIFYFFSI